MDSQTVVVGKYRLGELLGSGGMASVWSATNVFTDRRVAIKFMSARAGRTPEAMRRFLLEAKVSARVDHPNIVDVLDVGQTEDGTLFLVMELLSGVSLRAAMLRAKEPMRMRDFVFTMREVARGLGALHAQGIVHRDLKPTNIFLHKARSGDVHVKLLDFGVSKFLESDDNTLTLTGALLGSPYYMSPEQARGDRSIDGRTDVFALGATLFEALAGYRAYEPTQVHQLVVAIATREPRDIDDVERPIPKSLRSLIRDCLVTDRKKRLASFDIIAKRLDDALAELEKSTLCLPASSPQSGGTNISNMKSEPAAPAMEQARPKPAPRTTAPAVRFESRKRAPRKSWPLAILSVLIVAVCAFGSYHAYGSMSFRSWARLSCETMEDGVRALAARIGPMVRSIAPSESAPSSPLNPSRPAVAAPERATHIIPVDSLPVAPRSGAKCGDPHSKSLSSTCGSEP